MGTELEGDERLVVDATRGGRYRRPQLHRIAVEIDIEDETAGEPLEAAKVLVDELLDQRARAVRLTTELIDPSLSFEEYCERAIEYRWQCVNDDEHEKAVAAFSERRAPEDDQRRLLIFSDALLSSQIPSPRRT